MKVRTVKWGTLISGIALVLAICLIVPAVHAALTNVAYAVSGKNIHYFNDDVNSDPIGNNDFDFGPDRKVLADEAVASGEAKSIQEWVATREGTGDFFESIAIDPALCAAVAVHLDESLALPEVILYDEQDVIIGQRANEAHRHFLRDQGYWDETVALIVRYLSSSTISIQRSKNYTVGMYMWYRGLDGDKPSVIVHETDDIGGRVILFDLGKPGSVKFELDCGYQPVDVTYWPTPDAVSQLRTIIDEPETVKVSLVEEPKPTPISVPSKAPAKVTDEPFVPTVEPTQAPTMNPTKEPTAKPIVASEHATYTKIGTIGFYIDKEYVTIDAYAYAGGYFEDDDPRYADAVFETPESYGPSLLGNTRAQTIANWFHEFPKSPLQVVRVMIQTGLIKLEPLQSETDYAYELIRLAADEYDTAVNSTLAHVYNNLNGGKAVFSTNWTLENMMKEVNGKTILFGRLNGDDDKKKEDKDQLFTFFNASGSNFVSAWVGLSNTARDAKQDPRDFANRAWINADEGGTWKWKRGEVKVTETPSPTPTNTPTNTPSPTPTSTPTSTPTNSPSPTPTNTPSPSPSPTPTPTPTPKPSPTPTPLQTKDPDAGPQGQTEDEPGTEDFGGGQNHDPDEDLTEEPESPGTYVPPAPPEPDPTAAPTQKPTEKPTEKPTQKPTERPTQKPTERPTEKPTQKPTEKPTEKPTATPSPVPVVTATPKPTNTPKPTPTPKPLEQVQEEEHSEQTVEEPLQEDGLNEGDLDESQVE